MILRPYKPSDAAYIVEWLRDEKIHFYWGGYRFGEYPLTIQMINEKYLYHNGDCAEPDNFYPLTATEDGIPVGHMIIRYVNGERSNLRFGWVVVDSSKRGCGYGRKMLKLALDYAFRILKGERVTIGVFRNNSSAEKCYLSVGFLPDPEAAIISEAYQGVSYEIEELLIYGETYDKMTDE